MNALEKLLQVVGEIRAVKDPMRIRDNWQLAGRLAERLGGDREEVARAVRTQDVEGLERVVAGIQDKLSPAAARPAPRPEGSGAAFTTEDKAAAMRAFKKRLKLMRLSEESKLGGRQLTGGRKSDIDAILPPEQFPKAMWDQLVADGRLKYTGQGFYALAHEENDAG